MRSAAPVIHFAAGEIMKARRSEFSSGCPIAGDLSLFREFVRRFFNTHGVGRRLRPVITAPGTTLFTCTPPLMPCSAHALARAIIAALIVATAANAGLG
jgi:hypothetical protein